jgi:hypothetical protein
MHTLDRKAKYLQVKYATKLDNTAFPIDLKNKSRCRQTTDNCRASRGDRKSLGNCDRDPGIPKQPVGTHWTGQWPSQEWHLRPVKGLTCSSSRRVQIILLNKDPDEEKPTSSRYRVAEQRRWKVQLRAERCTVLSGVECKLASFEHHQKHRIECRVTRVRKDYLIISPKSPCK